MSEYSRDEAREKPVEVDANLISGVDSEDVSFGIVVSIEAGLGFTVNALGGDQGELQEFVNGFDRNRFLERIPAEIASLWHEALSLRRSGFCHWRASAVSLADSLNLHLLFDQSTSWQVASAPALSSEVDTD